MGFAIELYFDKGSEYKIRDYYSKIEDNHIPNIIIELKSRPHISLAVYSDNLNYKELMNKLNDFVLNQFKLSLTNIGFFCSEENTIFISPKITEELLGIHREFHSKFKDFRKAELKYYLPEYWIPHCTIAEEINDNDFLTILKILKDNFKPIVANINRMSLIKFRPIEYLYEKEF